MFYMLYAKPAGERRFSPLNPKTLEYGLCPMHAPRFPDSSLSALRAWVDGANGTGEGQFQVRTADGRHKVHPRGGRPA